MATTLRVDDVRRTERPAAPVRWWAGAGTFFVALQAYVYLRWVLSPDFHRVSPGPDSIPLSFRVLAHSAEILTIGLMVFGVYRYLYRPWRDQHSVSALGMMWLASLTTYFWDWSINWMAPVGRGQLHRRLLVQYGLLVQLHPGLGLTERHI